MWSRNIQMANQYTAWFGITHAQHVTDRLTDNQEDVLKIVVMIRIIIDICHESYLV